MFDLLSLGLCGKWSWREGFILPTTACWALPPPLPPAWSLIYSFGDTGWLESFSVSGSSARWFLGTWRPLAGLATCSLWSSETPTPWPWTPHLGPPSFSCWDGLVDIAEMSGLRSSVLLGAGFSWGVLLLLPTLIFSDKDTHRHTHSILSLFLWRTYLNAHDRQGRHGIEHKEGNM